MKSRSFRGPTVDLPLAASLDGHGQPASLDDHGQPAPQFNAQSRIERGIAELLGLVRGVLADGVLNEAEAHALRDWLEANPDLAGVWPVDKLAARLEQIFSDGVVDAEEREDLADLLKQIIGGKEDSSYGITAGHSASMALPLDEPPPGLEFNGFVYVFTGKFAYGTRKVCERVVMERGGTCGQSITKRTNVLVIGAFGSRDWVQSPYGRKIEKAVEYRQQGLPLAIVSEGHWAATVS